MDGKKRSTIIVVLVVAVVVAAALADNAGLFGAQFSVFNQDGQAGKSPNLVVEEITEATKEAGEFKVVIRNVGDGKVISKNDELIFLTADWLDECEADNAKTRLSENKIVPQLSAGADAVYFLSMPYTDEGLCGLRVTVDSENSVRESNEDDNARTLVR